MDKSGRLRNGGRAAPITTAWSAPRCTARSKRTREQCRAPAMRGKTKCYHHGGASTGPRNEEGRLRISEGNTKHGRYSKAQIEANRAAREAMRSLGWSWRLSLGRRYRYQPRDPVTGRFI